MGTTRCAFCDGYGHTYKVCPTGRKIARCVGDTRGTRVISLTRQLAIRSNGEIARHIAPAHSFVSAIGKRTRSNTEESIISQWMELDKKDQKRIRKLLDPAS